MEDSPRVKVSLTGAVALELIAPYFREAGFDVAPQDAPLDEFRPDFVYDVTSHDEVLSKEVPGFYDRRMERLSGCPYSLDGIRAIVDEFRWETMREEGPCGRRGQHALGRHPLRGRAGRA